MTPPTKPKKRGNQMKKRILQVLAFVAGLVLGPVWLLLWIVSGNQICFKLIIYAVSGEWEENE